MIQWFEGRTHIIGWVIIIGAVVIALYQNYQLTHRIEQESMARTQVSIELAERVERESINRAHALCVANNENRDVVATLLEAAAEPRENDSPGDYERRQQQLEPLLNLLEHEDCPPPPPPPMNNGGT